MRKNRHPLAVHSRGCNDDKVAPFLARRTEKCNILAAAKHLLVKRAAQSSPPFLAAATLEFFFVFFNLFLVFLFCFTTPTHPRRPGVRHREETILATPFYFTYIFFLSSRCNGSYSAAAAA
jgi:hypothetical protein